jgi:hypothetical protein
MGSSNFNQTKQAVADPNNNVTFLFDPPPLGYTLTGSITIINSPANIGWTVFRSGQAIDVTTGISSCSNIQCVSTDILTVVGANLPGGVTYQAAYVGIITPDNEAPTVVPGHDAYSSGESNVSSDSTGSVVITTPGVNVPLIVPEASFNYFILGLLTIFNVSGSSEMSIFDGPSLIIASFGVPDTTGTPFGSIDSGCILNYSSTPGNTIYARANASTLCRFTILYSMRP